MQERRLVGERLQGDALHVCASRAVCNWLTHTPPAAVDAEMRGAAA